MSTIKARLAIVLPGRVMTSQEGTACRQCINISDSTFQYWQSNEGKPSSITQKEWRSMSKKKRVLAHCALIKEDLHGKSFHLEINE